MNLKKMTKRFSVLLAFVILFSISSTFVQPAATPIFRFVVMSDSNGGANRVGSPGQITTTHELLAKNDMQAKQLGILPNFVIHTGDMVAGVSGTSESKANEMWNWFLKEITDYSSNNVPFFQLPGNHDASTTNLRRSYSNAWSSRKPSGVSGNWPYYYSFDYAGSHFIMLDGSGGSFPGKSPNQENWLDDELKNSQGKYNNIFVFTHVPFKAVNCGSEGSNSPFHKEHYFQNSKLESKLKNKGITVIFAGHNHCFVDDTSGGLRQITVGAMTEPRHTHMSNPSYSGTRSGIAIVDVYPGKEQYNVYMVDTVNGVPSNSFYGGSFPLLDERLSPDAAGSDGLVVGVSGGAETSSGSSGSTGSSTASAGQVPAGDVISFSYETYANTNDMAVITFDPAYFNLKLFYSNSVSGGNVASLDKFAVAYNSKAGSGTTAIASSGASSITSSVVSDLPFAFSGMGAITGNAISNFRSQFQQYQHTAECVPIKNEGINSESQRLKLYGSSRDDPKREFVLVDFGPQLIKVHKKTAHAFACVAKEIQKCPEYNSYDWDWISDPPLWRKIRGSTTTLSPHAWAIAIDINAYRNPMCPSKLFPQCGGQKKLITDIPTCFVEAFNKYGFSWGGDWGKNYYDPMHFEFRGDPNKLPAYNGIPRELPSSVTSADVPSEFSIEKDEEWYELQPRLKLAGMDKKIKMSCGTAVECAWVLDFWYRFLSDFTAEKIRDKFEAKCPKLDKCTIELTKNDLCNLAVSSDKGILGCGGAGVTASADADVGGGFAATTPGTAGTGPVSAGGVNLPAGMPVAGINGGQCTSDGRPTGGDGVADGKLVEKSKSGRWADYVLTVDYSGKVEAVKKSSFSFDSSNSKYESAVAGNILIDGDFVASQLYCLSKSTSTTGIGYCTQSRPRSLVCITNDNKVQLIAVKSAKQHSIANFLKSRCRQLFNLDGGGSVQYFYNVGDQKYSWKAEGDGRPVANHFLVIPRDGVTIPGTVGGTDPGGMAGSTNSGGFTTTPSGPGGEQVLIVKDPYFVLHIDDTGGVLKPGEFKGIVSEKGSVKFTIFIKTVQKAEKDVATLADEYRREKVNSLPAEDQDKAIVIYYARTAPGDKSDVIVINVKEGILSRAAVMYAKEITERIKTSDAGTKLSVNQGMKEIVVAIEQAIKGERFLPEGGVDGSGGPALHGLFAYDSTNIVSPPEYQQRISDFVDVAKKNNVQTLHVYAYASQEGTEAYNIDLSRRRADAVKSLINGVNVETHAGGESTQWGGLEENRRFIINYGGAPGMEMVKMECLFSEGKSGKEDIIEPANPQESIDKFVNQAVSDNVATITLNTYASTEEQNPKPLSEERAKTVLGMIGSKIRVVSSPSGATSIFSSTDPKKNSKCVLSYERSSSPSASTYGANVYFMITIEDDADAVEDEVVKSAFPSSGDVGYNIIIKTVKSSEDANADAQNYYNENIPAGQRSSSILIFYAAEGKGDSKHDIAVIHGGLLEDSTMTAVNQIVDMLKTGKEITQVIPSGPTSAVSGGGSNVPGGTSSAGGTTSGKCQNLVDYAAEYIGTKYDKADLCSAEKAKAGKCTTQCGSFITSVFHYTLGKEPLGNGKNKCSAIGMRKIGTDVKDLQPGDVFSAKSCSSSDGHTGMFVGYGRIGGETWGKNNNKHSEFIPVPNGEPVFIHQGSPVAYSTYNELFGSGGCYTMISFCRHKQCEGEVQKPSASGTSGTVAASSDGAVGSTVSCPPPFVTGNSKSTGSEGGNGKLENGVLLGPHETNIYIQVDSSIAREKSAGHRLMYGTAEMINVLLQTACNINQKFGAKLPLGDISKQGGGPIASHDTHRSGRNVDIYFLYKDSSGKFITTRDRDSYDNQAGYTFDPQANFEIIKALFSNPNTKRAIVNSGRISAMESWAQKNDPSNLKYLKEPYMGSVSDHTNHFHVSLKSSPVGPNVS